MLLRNSRYAVPLRASHSRHGGRSRGGVNSYTDPSQWGKYYQALVSTPRTIGVTVAYSFKGP
jgi:hypothetical protein